MRKQKKQERALKGLQEWLAKAGVQQEIIAEAAERTDLTKQDKSLQAEAVLLSLQKPMGFVTKLCRWCEEPFQTNYRSVAFCSDNHRAKALKAQGIIWNPSKSAEERWGGEPPLVIPPEAQKKLLAWAKILVERGNGSLEPIPDPESTGLTLPADPTLDFDPIQEDARRYFAELGRGTLEIPEQVSHPQTSDAHTSPGISLPSLDDLLA